jgi:GTPase SAR1 family protein
MEHTQQDTREKFGRFRILVVGRANAGKTTLLQRVCNTTEKPEIFDREGNKVDLALHATSASPIDQWRSD